jgi:Skp family chaperone for outer membrane proteins
LLCAALLAFAASCAAESQRLAIVNVSYVFEKYDKVKDVQARIDMMHDARKNN